MINRIRRQEGVMLNSESPKVNARNQVKVILSQAITLHHPLT